jgi:hypothetical protein
MDPYLEGSYWSSFPSQLSVEIARQLSPQIRPKYVALNNERYVLDETESVELTTAEVYPDVSVLETRSKGTIGAAGVLEAPLRLATVVPRSYRVVNVEIRDTRNRRLVTHLEVFSPANKRGSGRLKYLKKRRRLLSTAHLIEIDLLRQGRRVPMRKPLPAAPGFVLLSREAMRPITDVWPIGLRNPLPEIPVPLLEGDPDVLLDLQSAFSNVYDAVGFDLLIDYSLPPAVPLPSEDADWAKSVVANRAVPE